MADTLQFDLVSPERMLLSTEATMVQIPGVEGDFTALPAHAPFLTTLRPGMVTVSTASGSQVFFVSGGFAEISGESASVLAEEAVERDALDRAFLEQKVEEAEAALEAAPDHAKMAASQRLMDFRAALSAL